MQIPNFLTFLILLDVERAEFQLDIVFLCSFFSSRVFHVTVSITKVALQVDAVQVTANVQQNYRHTHIDMSVTNYLIM